MIIMIQRIQANQFVYFVKLRDVEQEENKTTYKCAG